MMIRAANLLLEAGAGRIGPIADLAWLASHFAPGAGLARASHLRFKPDRSVIGRLTDATGAPVGWVAGYAPVAADKAERLLRLGEKAGLELPVLDLGEGHALIAGPLGLDKRLGRWLRNTKIARSDRSVRGRVLAYNPGRRLVVRQPAAPDGFRSGAGDVVVKVSLASCAHVLPLTTALHAAGVPALVPHAVEGYEEHLLAFEHYGSGDLATGGSAEEFVEAGQTLHRWHGASGTVQGAARLPMVDVEERLGAVVSGVEGILPAAAGSARKAARAVAAALPGATAPTGGDVVAVHGDFSADQLLRGPEGLRVIDADRAAWAHPGWDVGSFVAASVLADGVDQGAAAAADLLTGYGPAAHVPAFTGAHVFLRALEPFRAALPGWQGLVAARLEAAARLAGASPHASIAAVSDALSAADVKELAL